MILVIVPLIVLFIVVVFSLFTVGGIQFVMSGDGSFKKDRQDRLDRMNSKVGTPYPKVDSLKAELSKKFRVRLADIAAGKGNTAQAAGELSALGIKISDALKNSDHALDIVLTGLSKMKSPVGKSSVATSLFGSVLSSKLMAEWYKSP